MHNSETRASRQRPERTVILNVSESVDGDGINLIELTGTIRKSAPRVVLLALLLALLVLVCSFLVTPKYLAETVVVQVEQAGASGGIAEMAGSLGGIAALAGIDLSSSQSGKEALAILKSKSFASKFILENGLVQVLFDDEWDSEKRGWKDSAEAPTRNDAVDYFLEDVVRVVEQSDSGTIAVRVYWKDRELAADWANRVVAEINRHIREKKITDAQRSIEYLEAERAKTGIIEVQQGISLLIQQQIENAMLANVQEDYAFKIIDPAVAPDEDDYASPNRVLWAAVTAALVLFGSLVIVVLRVTLGSEVYAPRSDSE